MATPATIGAWLGSWRLMAIDGVTLVVPDTGDNEAAFGRPCSRTAQGAAFPQVRVVGLGECSTHAVIAAELGPISTGERELAHTVLADCEQGMLVIFDRGFYSYGFFTAARDTARTYCSESPPASNCRSSSACPMTPTCRRSPRTASAHRQR